LTNQSASVILLSPYSRELRNGNRNPKNYPHWAEVVAAFKALHENITVVQVGVMGEKPIVGIDEHLMGLPLQELKDIAQEAAGWCSVDNFFPHFMSSEVRPRKYGLVFWGPSDSNLFGYGGNINVRGELPPRENQFAKWEDCQYNADWFLKDPTDEVTEYYMEITE